MENEKKTAIAINVCYGGFSVSQEADAWMKERGLDFRPYHHEHRIHPVLIDAINKFGDAFPEPGYPTVISIETFTGDLFRVDEYDGFESVTTPGEMQYFSVSSINGTT